MERLRRIWDAEPLRIIGIAITVIFLVSQGISDGLSPAELIASLSGWLVAELGRLKVYSPASFKRKVNVAAQIMRMSKRPVPETPVEFDHERPA